jgi:ABC-2 type transport system ATP-binding protein
MEQPMTITDAMLPTKEQTVVIRDVVKSFGRKQALAGVSFVADRGVTGLLGPNGAGKTTLLRIMATVLAPDRGEVSLLGLDPDNRAERLEIRRALGYMPQDAGLYRTFTPFEFVDYVAILKEMTDRRSRHDEVRRVLGVTGLTPEMHRQIRTLSGGMRRRIALAQALLGDPRLLVLDEPTVGLDPEQRLRFREVVSGLAERHTVILSTHQTEDVAALCRHVVVIDGGTVLAEGAPADLTDAARGRVWVSDQRDPGARLAWLSGDGRTRQIGDPPAGAELADPRIEDAYLLLVGRHANDGG